MFSRHPYKKGHYDVEDCFRRVPGLRYCPKAGRMVLLQDGKCMVPDCPDRGSAECLEETEKNSEK